MSTRSTRALVLALALVVLTAGTGTASAASPAPPAAAPVTVTDANGNPWSSRTRRASSPWEAPSRRSSTRSARRISWSASMRPAYIRPTRSPTRPTSATIASLARSRSSARTPRSSSARRRRVRPTASTRSRRPASRRSSFPSRSPLTLRRLGSRRSARRSGVTPRPRPVSSSTRMSPTPGARGDGDKLAQGDVRPGGRPTTVLVPGQGPKPQIMIGLAGATNAVTAYPGYRAADRGGSRGRRAGHHPDRQSGLGGRGVLGCSRSRAWRRRRRARRARRSTWTICTCWASVLGPARWCQDLARLLHPELPPAGK